MIKNGFYNAFTNTSEGIVEVQGNKIISTCTSKQGFNIVGDDLEDYLNNPIMDDGSVDWCMTRINGESCGDCWGEGCKNFLQIGTEVLSNGI